MLALLLALSPAAAADLSLGLSWYGAAAPLELTLRDVGFGDLPAFVVPDGRDGWSRRVHLTLADAGEGRVRFSVRVYEVEERRPGVERVTLLAEPVITALPGERAMVRQGTRVPLPDGSFEDRDVLNLRLLLGDPAS